MDLSSFFMTLLQKRIEEHDRKKNLLAFVDNRVHQFYYSVILKRRIYDFYRKYYRYRNHFQELDSSLGESEVNNESIDENKFVKLNRLDIRFALSFFPRFNIVRRECMTLYWLESWSFVNIAKKLGVTEGNVRYHVKAGTAQLREWLEEEPPIE